VVDGGNRLYGYRNLLVCDGAAIPANPGVNPSLTITAVAEHAMSEIPLKDGSEPRHLPEQARPAQTAAS
jgi:cholesterol oxidase